MDARHIAKISELVENLARSIQFDAERLGDCGAIDPGDFNPDEYVLAKLLVTAAARSNKDIYAPLYGQHKKDLKNLAHF